MKIKTKFCDIYLDDPDFERRIKFRNESDKMVEKNEPQIDAEKDKPEDKYVINNMRK